MFRVMLVVWVPPILLDFAPIFLKKFSFLPPNFFHGHLPEDGREVQIEFDRMDDDDDDDDGGRRTLSEK